MLTIEGTDGAKPSLYILDAMNFLFRAFHALPPLKTTQGKQTGAIYGLCQMMLRIEREQKPTHLCVVYDAPGENFRKQIYGNYKAHRPPMPPELGDQLGMVRRVIDAFGLAQLEVSGFEADDIIATLTKVARAAGMDVVICSSDKDLTQLCTDDGGVAVLDTMKNRRIGPPEVREKFGVGPEQVGDVLALMGDSIDNVPGVAGIGPKTASELINKFGSLDALLAAAAAGGVPGKRGVAIHEAREAIRVSRELVRLRDDVPLPKPLEELHRIEPDKKRLRGLFTELEFFRLADQLSASGAAAIAPHAENTPAPVPTSAAPEPIAPVAPPPRVAAVTKRADLEALAADIRAAGAVALSALYDGPSAVRSDLVGIGIAFARRGPGGSLTPPRWARPGKARLPDAIRRAYLPLVHRYLGAPSCLPESEALAVLGPLLASPEVAKHVHDAKTLEVLLLRRGVQLAGVASDAMLAAYLLDASRTRYDLDVITAAEGIPGVAGRASWIGSGASAKSGSDISVEEVGAWLAAEAAAALALAARQPARLATAGLEPLYRDMELPLAHVLAHIECRGIQLDTDRLREIGAGGRRAARRAGDGDPRAGGDAVQHQLAQAARRRSVRQAVAAGGAQDEDRPVDRRGHAGGAGRAAPGARQDRRLPGAVEAEGDVHRRAAGAGEPGDRAPAHVVQPGGRRDGAAVVQQPQPTEHPDPVARSAGASARRSSPSPATCWSRRTTRRSSCGSSRTSRRIRRSWTRSDRAKTSTSARPRRCSACRRRR